VLKYTVDRNNGKHPVDLREGKTAYHGEGEKINLRVTMILMSLESDFRTWAKSGRMNITNGEWGGGEGSREHAVIYPSSRVMRELGANTRSISREKVRDSRNRKTSRPDLIWNTEEK